MRLGREQLEDLAVGEVHQLAAGDPGYRPEGSRLHPAWSPCTLRMLRVQVVGTRRSTCGRHLSSTSRTPCGHVNVTEIERDGRVVAVRQCREPRLVHHLPAVGHVDASITGGICLGVPRICAGLGVDYICPGGQAQQVRLVDGNVLCLGAV